MALDINKPVKLRCGVPVTLRPDVVLENTQHSLVGVIHWSRSPEYYDTADDGSPEPDTVDCWTPGGQWNSLGPSDMDLVNVEGA